MTLNFITIWPNCVFQKNEVLAWRILSNICEIKLDNPQLLRMVAFEMEARNENEKAALLFQKLKTLRPEEPQTLRDLALIMKKNKQYLQALQLLSQVIEGQWDVRFSQIEVVAMMDMVSIAQLLDPLKLDTAPEIVHTILLNPLKVELRIVLTWDTDMTDLELIIKEPSGEICNSFHNHTTSGGMLSRDFSGGYGPIEYITKTAQGTYQVSLKVSSPSFSSCTTAKICLFTFYGNTQLEKEKIITLRLPNDMNLLVNILTVTFANNIC